MKVDLEENIKRYNKLIGVIKIHFRKNMSPETQLRMHNAL
jgi:hypothetical protein